MKKEYPADVICQFTTEGKIIPLKIRIEEDGYREFKILTYKEKYKHLEYRRGFMADYQIASQIQYCCRIDVKGTEREVYLKYDTEERRWTVSFT